MKGKQGFQKGHKINVGNTFAKGVKHTEEWKKKASNRLVGNTNGFKLGNPSPRKGKKSTKPAWNKGMKMPERCGVNHPHWISDRSKIKQQDRRNNPRYKEWRNAVYKRDAFSCRIGNKECSRKIEAHHILRWSEYPELRYDVNNGITLCSYHHPTRKEEERAMTKTFLDVINSTIPYSA